MKYTVSKCICKSATYRNVVGLLVTFCWGLINGSADSGSIHLDLRSLPNTIGSSGVLLKMEVGIRKGAWRRAWRYPAYLWSLRWVYAVKKPGGWYTAYTRVYHPIHHWEEVVPLPVKHYHQCAAVMTGYAPSDFGTQQDMAMLLLLAVRSC